MKHFTIILCGFLLWSCAGEGNKSGDSDTAEPNETPNVESVLKSIDQVKNDSDEKAKIFRSAIRENINADLDEKAAFIFRTVLYNYDSETDIKELVPVFLEEAKDRVAIENFYDGILSSFITKYPQHPYSAKVENTPTISTLLDEKADLISNNNFNRFSVPDARDYIELSETYALVFPRDEDAGSQLIKAGNTAKSINGYGAKAVYMYDWLLEKQPGHQRAPQALFLKAFTYDNELNNPEMATKYYTEFLDNYPEDDFADEAKILLDNVGKTDEEFYESIVNKKQAQ